MKSISTMPPAAYFRSQTSSSPFSSAIARRMSATSVATPAASRGRVSTSRMMRLDPGAKRRRRRNHPRPGQRHVLPGPGLALLVFGEGVEARGHRTRAARRTQPHVDLVQHAVIGPRRECADQPLGEAARNNARHAAIARRRNPAARDRNRRAGSDRDRTTPSSRGCRAGPSRGSRSACPLIRPCWAANRSVTRPCTVCDNALGDVGKGDAGLLGGDRAGQDARADQEQALLAEQPQAVEEFLVGIAHPSASPRAAPTIRAGPASRRRSADRSVRP